MANSISVPISSKLVDLRQSLEVIGIFQKKMAARASKVCFQLWV